MSRNHDFVEYVTRAAKVKELPARTNARFMKEFERRFGVGAKFSDHWDEFDEIWEWARQAEIDAELARLRIAYETQ